MAESANSSVLSEGDSREKDVEKLGEGLDREPTRHEDEEDEVPQELRSVSKSNTRDTSNLIIVKWEENDPENPFNFPDRKKWFITLQLGLLALAASLGSSITASANPSIAAYTGVSEEVSVLTVSLYVLGFCVGPCSMSSILDTNLHLLTYV